MRNGRLIGICGLVFGIATFSQAGFKDALKSVAQSASGEISAGLGGKSEPVTNVISDGAATAQIVATDESQQIGEQAAKDEMRIKKLAQVEADAKAILEKNKKAEQMAISLRGIYIGMPMEDVIKILQYRLNILDMNDAASYMFRIPLDEQNGRLSLFGMDAGITMQFFGSPTITGEELAQQLADKYGITLEVDAYGRSWQYRDAKSGVKIQIGADGSILMEKIQSLLGDDDYSSELQKARNIADVEKAKGVLTLPAGVVPGAMNADSRTIITSGIGLKNLLTALGIDDLSQLTVNGQAIDIGDLNGTSAHY